MQEGTSEATAAAPAACFAQTLKARKGAVVHAEFTDACPESPLRTMLCSVLDECAAARPAVNAPYTAEAASIAALEGRQTLPAGAAAAASDGGAAAKADDDAHPLLHRSRKFGRRGRHNSARRASL